jgi:hypothetical protein
MEITLCSHQLAPSYPLGSLGESIALLSCSPTHARLSDLSNTLGSVLPRRTRCFPIQWTLANIVAGRLSYPTPALGFSTFLFSMVDSDYAFYFLY